MRPRIVFGPRSRWTAGLADQLLEGTACLVNNGSGICNSVYVDNLVEAIRLSMTTREADGHAFLIGDQEEVTWLQLYLPIARALNIQPGQIPPVEPPELIGRGREMSNRLKASKVVQAILPLLSARFKGALKAALSNWEQAPPPSPWALNREGGPHITEEMALLQQCQYKLPSGKARKILGYRPPISFAEGCQRSVAWLSFAGYPVQSTGASAQAVEIPSPPLDT